MAELFPIREFDFRWAAPGRFSDAGNDIVAWFSCRVGPVYLNNGQVETAGGRVVITWPKMRSSGHFWWRPCDPEYERYFEQEARKAFGAFLEQDGEARPDPRALLVERLRKGPGKA